MVLSDMSTEVLVNECVTLEKMRKDNARNLNERKAELQARGIQTMEDKNIKYVKFYSDAGAVSITDSMSLDVLNLDRFKEIIGEGLYKQKVEEVTKINTKFDTKFEKAVKAAFAGEYTFEYTLEGFLDHMSVHPDAAQKKLSLKKVKGDYEKDRALLVSIFGEGDYEVEQFYFYRIKNAELIKAFLGTDDVDELTCKIEELKKYIIVDTKTSIAIEVKEEEQNEQ